MATRCNEKFISKKKTIFSNGHRIQYDFPVRNLASEQSWDFTQSYETSCEVLPTSWFFRMEFHRISDDGSVSIPFTLCRHDSMDRPVNVFIWVSLSDAEDEPFFDFPEIFRKDIINSGEELQNTIVGNIKCPQLRASYNNMVDVCVVLEIRYCHRENMKDPSTNLSDAKEVLSSKM